MKKKIYLTFLFLTVTGIIIFIIIAVLYSLIFEKMSPVEIITSGSIWTFWLIAVGALVLVYVINYKGNGSKRVLKVNYMEDSHWMTFAEIKKMPNLTLTTLKELPDVPDGVPIYAEKHKNDIDIVLARPIHTLIIGTTGSGKTSGYVDPTIQILSRTKAKPSLVITDPKGELYLHHSKSLEKQGYKIYLIDLKDIYRSTKWNPFAEVIRKTEETLTAKVEYDKGKYYFQGAEYLSLDTAEKELKLYNQQLNDEIYEDIQDIIYTTCPIENKNDSTWQKGARDLIFALALAFWEDVRDGLMLKKQFNFYNLYKNISLYCTDECKEFKSYFENRQKFSKTKGLANTVLVSQDKTLTSYLGDINQYFNWMADTGISSFTAENEIDITKFDDEPSALFLRIPEDKENRHKLITLFITQMYKALVAKAGHNEKIGKAKVEELMRSVYFIMDEFGNLPKFNSLEKIVTIGRSRKVYLMPIIQDFAQLENKYSKEVSNILKSNCNINIFIGSKDPGTIKEYSELCGKCKTRSISYSEQKEVSISTSAQERPLIYPIELQTLNDPPHKMGNAVVLAYGKHPLKSRFTPPFKVQAAYDMQGGAFEKREAELFQEEDYFYDIVQRNVFLDEIDNLQKQQDEVLQKMLNTINREEESEIKKDDSAKLLQQKLADKLAALTGKISAATLQQLSDAPANEKTKLLDDLIDSAAENKNNFLLFELAYLKTFIEEILPKLLQEKTKN
ncbi:MAG: type IV secretory system conjugative DNA transfer family protein [Clostridiales bacterium]|nr:type IV secretory system conjugative DNA transfer family protein [Clostridiales bacterium]